MAAIDNKPAQNTASKSSAEALEEVSQPTPSGAEALNREQLQIANWLKTARFRKQLFGGISEEDVWKKIEQLNELYDAALRAERIRYDVLLKERLNNTEPLPQAAETHKGNTADE